MPAAPGCARPPVVRPRLPSEGRSFRTAAATDPPRSSHHGRGPKPWWLGRGPLPEVGASASTAARTPRSISRLGFAKSGFKRRRLGERVPTGTPRSVKSAVGSFDPPTDRLSSLHLDEARAEGNRPITALSRARGCCVAGVARRRSTSSSPVGTVMSSGTSSNAHFRAGEEAATLATVPAEVRHELEHGIRPMCCPRPWPRPSTWSSRHDRRCRVMLRGRVGGETDERQIEPRALGRPGRRCRSARPPLWPAPNLRAHLFLPLDNERNHEPARELLHPFGRARGPRDRLDGPGEIGTVRRLPAPERACHRNARFPGPLRPVPAAAGRRVRRAGGQIESKSRVRVAGFRRTGRRRPGTDRVRSAVFAFELGAATFGAGSSPDGGAKAARWWPGALGIPRLQPDGIRSGECSGIVRRAGPSTRCGFSDRLAELCRRNGASRSTALAR
jgi:hypothetical protein